MNISLEPVKFTEKEILKNLGELYIYELSQYSSVDVNDLGLYDDLDDLDLYWAEENRHPFFIKVNNKLAGFVLVFDGRQIEEIESNYSIDDFFIMYQYKKKGIGKHCAKYIFDRFKGKWQIWFHPRNEIAKNFWINTVDEYTKGKF
ncbi:MAG: GNAT family N-acetyltransferase [Defluviitaleaceae bacterium]|nr:GNAT family N-acetyltransferase [Defluviitaleaceae bacterium]MCL2836070.1 GNAT family N-acetyltransferase [Defluviitaleaceae bacterium]